MYSLTIAVGNTVWALMYREKDVAEGAFKTLREFYSGSPADTFSKPGGVYLQDHFGQQIVVCAGSLHGYVLEDLTMSKQAHVERSLHQARTTIEAQEAWKKEPLARAGMHGPSVLTPGMIGANGRFPQ